MKEFDSLLPDHFFREHLKHFPIVTTDLVVKTSGQEFLLVRRSSKNLNWKGVWATPGGRVFRNESLSEAARRILGREAGIELPPSSFHFCGVQEIMTTKEHGVSVIYSTSTKKREVTPDDSSVSVRWFSSVRYPNNLKPEYREILRKGGVKLSINGAKERQNEF